MGRNCALTRKVLERSGGFNTPAPTGTDYILAKELIGMGVFIRQNPDSCIATAFPTTFQSYLCQQRRWIYNVMAYGQHYGARDEVKASLFDSMVGLWMLVLPFAAILLGPAFFSVWAVLFFSAWLSRIRYWKVFCKVHERKNYKTVVFQPLYLLIDFFAWVMPLVEFSPFKKGVHW